MSKKCACGNGLLRDTKWGEICGICDYKIEHGEWDEFTVEIINRFGLKLFRFCFSDGSKKLSYGKTVGDAFRALELSEKAVSMLDHYDVITPNHFRYGEISDNIHRESYKELIEKICEDFIEEGGDGI